MKQQPKISVIIPVYNTASYLSACLDSVCNQAYPQLEIICVNDGSTDDSAAILNEYASKDTRITVIHQKNSGQASARNQALDIATGDWILGLDSDDTLAPHTLEKLSFHMLDDVDIIWYGIKLISEQQLDDSYFRSPYTGKQKVTEELLKITSVHFGGKVWRRSFIEQQALRFPAGRLYEDAFFFYAAAPCARHIYFENEQLYHYLIRSDSTMGQTQKRTPRGIDHLHIAELLFQRWRKHPLPPLFYSLHKPSSFELFIFTAYYNATLGTIPKEMRREAQKMALRIGREYGFFREYPRQTAYIRFNTPLYRLFIKYKSDYVQYRFFGIPLIKQKLNAIIALAISLFMA